MKTAIPVTLICIIFSVFYSGCEIEDYPFFLSIAEDPEDPEEETPEDHGKMWVANAHDNTVTCIDRFEDIVVGTYSLVPLGSDPSRTAVDLDGNCWVGSRGSTTVHFVTPDGSVRQYDGFSSPRGVALDRQGNVWIANTGGTIQRITASSGQVSVAVAIGDPIGSSYFYGALVDSKGFLWIYDSGNRVLIKYDTSKFPAIASETIAGISGYGFTIDLAGKVWVAGSGQLHKVDADSAILEQTYTVAGATSGVVFDINGDIWICADGNDSVIQFDPDTETAVTHPAGGNGPHGIGADDDGYVYSVNMHSDNVCKIDINSGEVVKTYPVGDVPYTYSDLTGFIYRHVTLK